MKYNINLYQKQLIQLSPDITLAEAALLEVIAGMCNSTGKMKRISVKKKKFTWVNLDQLKSEIPLIKWTCNASFSNHIDNLAKYGYLIKWHKDKRLYCALTAKYNRLFTDAKGEMENAIILDFKRKTGAK